MQSSQRLLTSLLVAVTFAGSWNVPAEVPRLLNYQGRVWVGTNAFDGIGQFKFALVSGDGLEVYWRNGADADENQEPDAHVLVRVTQGIYSVALGDPALLNMAELPDDAFQNNDVYLRVWFNDGTHGFQRLVPDQRIAAVAYAIVAGSVADGSITPAKLDPKLMEQMTVLSNLMSTISASGLTVVSAHSRDAGLLEKGFLPFSSIAAPAWVNGETAGSPAARLGHTAVWTGEEMLIWGGTLAPNLYSNGGAGYRPDRDAWNPISPIEAPQGRTRHSAVWSGEEMLIWGGFSQSGFRHDGARFDPAQQQWRSISTHQAPVGRDSHVAVWTGTRLLIWGGRGSSGLLQDGAAYDPELDIWTPLDVNGAPSARAGATGLWTGDRMIVWGGEDTNGPLNSGAQLVFDATGSAAEWQPVSSTDAPGPRTGHSSVWAGEVMMVWGGQDNGLFLRDGGIFDPATGSWEAIPAEHAPSARSGHHAVWTGQEMVIFGGNTASGPTASGAAYDPTAKKWRPLTNGGNPIARTSATAVWSGSELFIFGGSTSGRTVAALQRVNPQPVWYFYRKP